MISGNGGDGVEVSYYRDSNDPTPPTGNRILSNSIYDNDALGIDLATPPNELPGVTNNDKKDPDTGANRRQNFPVLSSATLSGLLNSRPRKTFTNQFFSSPTEDPSGFGEGKTFLGEKEVRTNRKGKRSFNTTFVPLQPVSPGEKITATATNKLTGRHLGVFCGQGSNIERFAEGLCPSADPGFSLQVAGFKDFS